MFIIISDNISLQIGLLVPGIVYLSDSVIKVIVMLILSTRSQAVARIANRRPTAKNCRGHVTQVTPTFREIYLCACSAFPYKAVYQI